MNLFDQGAAALLKTLDSPTRSKVARDQLDWVYRSVALGISGHAFAATLLFCLLYSRHPRFLLAWYSTFVAAALLASFVCWARKRASTRGQPVDGIVWHCWAIVGMALNGLFWGVLGYVILPLCTAQVQTIVMVMIGGIAAAGASWFAAKPIVANSQVAGCSVPIIASLLIRGGYLNNLMALMVIVYLVILLLSIRMHWGTNTLGVCQRYANEKLMRDILIAKTDLEVSHARLDTALAQNRFILNSVAAAIAHTRDGKIVACNEYFRRIFGQDCRQLVDIDLRGHESLAVAFDLPRPREGAQSLDLWEDDVMLTRTDGSKYWVHRSVKCIEPTRPDSDALWVFSDITARKNRELADQRDAQSDPLTGLRNRRALLHDLTTVLVDAANNKTEAAVLFIDLDGFKAINDSSGHDAGDFTLRTVAERLRNAGRVEDRVFRLGGDEFIVLIANMQDVSGANVIAHKILASVAKPFTWSGISLQVHASIGLAHYPAHGREAQKLIDAADKAMYAAKRAGKSRVAIYQPDAEAILGTMNPSEFVTELGLS